MRFISLTKRKLLFPRGVASESGKVKALLNSETGALELSNELFPRKKQSFLRDFLIALKIKAMSFLSRYTTVLLALILTGFLLYLGKDVFVPFLLSLLLFYLIIQLRDAYRRVLPLKKYPKLSWLPLVLALITIYFILSFLLGLITSNLQQVLVVAPEYQRKLQLMIEAIFSQMGQPAPESLRELLGSFQLSQWLSSLLAVITSIASKTGIIFIYTLFLLLESHQFHNKLKYLKKHSKVITSISQIFPQGLRDVRTYWKIKALASLATGMLSYLFLFAFQVEFATFWGLLIFLLNFIPTVGSIIAIIFPILIAMLQFSTWLPIICIIIGLISIQVLIGNILEPRFMGNSLNLSPLVIVLSLVFWGMIWGVLGMVFSIPIMATINIILAKIPATKTIAILLSQKGNIEPLTPIPAKIDLRKKLHKSLQKKA